MADVFEYTAVVESADDLQASAVACRFDWHTVSWCMRSSAYTSDISAPALVMLIPISQAAVFVNQQVSAGSHHLLLSDLML